MTDTATHKACRACGRMFKRSPADSTVYCPEHRGNGRYVSTPKPKGYAAVTCDIHGIEYTTLNCPKCFPKS